MTTPLTPIPARLRDLKGDVAPTAPTNGQGLVWVVDAWTPADVLSPDGDGSQLTGITQLQVDGLVDALATLDAAIDAIAADPTIVRISGSYGNPTWLTSLAGSKITGNIPGNAASITGTIAQNQVVNLVSDLTLKAPLASPALTGTPTAPTAAAGTATTQIATCSFVDTTRLKIGNVVSGGTAGRVLFAGAGAVLADSANLIWDATNNRLGIGGAPFSVVDVRQTVNAGAANVDFTNTASSLSNIGQSIRLRLGPWNGFLGSNVYPYIESLIDSAGAAGIAIGTYNGDGLPSPERIRFGSNGRVGVNVQNIGAQFHLQTRTATTPGLIVQGTTSQATTAPLAQFLDVTGALATRVKNDCSISLVTLADSAASNSSLYFSSTQNKLVWKDAAGTVNPLY